MADNVGVQFSLTLVHTEIERKVGTFSESCGVTVVFRSAGILQLTERARSAVSRTVSAERSPDR